MKTQSIPAFALLLSAVLANSLLFLVSYKTPLDTKHSISTLGTQAQVLEVTLNTLWDEVDLKHIDTVVDVLGCKVLSMLSAEALRGRITVININNYEVEGEEQIDVRKDKELPRLASVINVMGIKRLCVISSVENLSYQQFFGQYPDLVVFRLPIATGISTSSLEAIVRKQAKSQGLTSFLVLLPPLTVSKLLAALDSLYKSAVTVFLSNSAAAYRFSLSGERTGLELSGPLFLTSAGCEGTDTEAAAFLCGLQQSASGKDWAVMQMENGNETQVGWISDGVIIGELSFQLPVGAAKEIVPTIAFSINSGFINPSGSSYSQNLQEYACTELAVADVNSSAVLLPHFSLQKYQLSLGANEFNATWVSKRLSPLNEGHLGVAMLTGTFSNVAIGVSKLLQSLHYELPQIGSANTLPGLSSPRDFPFYTRVIRSNAFLIVIYGWLLEHYNWRQICVVHANDTWSLGMLELLANETRRRGIEISNRQQLRLIPDDPKSNNFTAVFKEVVRTRVRVVIVLAFYDVVVQSLAALYDLGMRSGDLVFLAVNWLQQGLFETEDKPLLAKVNELCQGAIMILPSAFVGTVGEEVAHKYESAFNSTPSSFCCYYYDSVLLLAHALEDAIVAGHNYQSARVLNKALRNARFKGCSGLVTIEDDSNDRSLMPYSILNARMYSDRNMVIEEVGTYDPAGVQLLNFTAAILWPGNTTTAPTAVREFAPGCPFEAKHVVSYPAATALSSVTLVLISVGSLLVAAVFRVKCWYQSAKPLCTRAEESFEDYFAFFLIAAQSAQHASFGPALQSWALLHQFLGSLLLVRLDQISEVNGANYWAVLATAKGAVGLWTVLLVAGRVRKVHCVVQFGEKVYRRVMPLLGELCFLPILSTLLSLFQCPKVVLNDNETLSVQQAFLQWDCHLFCWTKEHLGFVVGALVCLGIYVPSAVYLRPVWQHLSFSLHVYYSPKHVMTRSMYEIIIVLLEKTMRTEMPLVHGVLFLLVTTAYLLVSLRGKAYGYSRANLWQRLSVVSVLCVSLLTLLARTLRAGSFLLWMCVYLGVLVAITVFGIVYQLVRLPAMLYTRKGHNVTALFQFMLSCRGMKYLMPVAPSVSGVAVISTMQARHRVPSQCPRIAWMEGK